MLKFAPTTMSGYVLPAPARAGRSEGAVAKVRSEGAVGGCGRKAHGHAAPGGIGRGAGGHSGAERKSANAASDWPGTHGIDFEIVVR